MKFNLAYQCMLQGKKIKRPSFNGYWYINGVSGEFTIHLANGEEITNGNLGLTILNVLAEDWEIYDEEILNLFKEFNVFCDGVNSKVFNDRKKTKEKEKKED